ncbi:transposase, partial [Aeromonas veronii]
MTRLRCSFTAEFKLEAASLVLDQGYSVPEASRSLDVGETVLRRWVQQLQSERTGTTPISKALTPEQGLVDQIRSQIAVPQPFETTQFTGWRTGIPSPVSLFITFTPAR